MKANELMIGDWVLDGKSIIQVTSISVLGGDVVGTITPFSSIERYYADNIVANSRGARSLDQLKPIPLTAEILAKNGFEQDALYGDWIMGKKSPSIMDRGFYLEIQELEDTNSWGCEISRNNGIHIRYSCSNCIVLVYVHELQHALRLCGLNELADNFKV